MKIELLRVGQSNRGTFGVLRQQEIPFALTLERPWVDNQANISCIPAGSYTCQRIRSPKFGETFEVMNVPNRSHVLFHKGNTLDDTHGCILVAEEFSGTFDHPMLASSARGFGELMQLLEGRATFEITVVDAPVVPVAAVQI